MNTRHVIITTSVLFALFQRGFAETEKIGDYTWQYSVVDGKAWIGSGVAEMAAITPKPVGEVTVPSELGGYEVWRLDAYALYGCDEMTRLVIPDCIHQCGGSAFRNCVALEEVHLPSNLEYIAGSLFFNCAALKEVVLPDNVGKIDDRAFQSCLELTNIVISASLCMIGSDAFYNCQSLTDVVVPNSVTNIGKYAFSMCTGLESLTLPFIGSERGNQGTEESVFGHLFGTSENEALTNAVQAYTYESNTLTISRYLPKSLKRIVITDETRIAKGAFDNCRRVTSIELNDGITSIGEYAFAHCRNLKAISIPNSVTNVEKSIFTDCGNLRDLTLPFVGSRRGNSGTEDSTLGFIFGVVKSDDENCVQITQWYGDAGKSIKRNMPSQLSVKITDETYIPYGSFDGCINLINVEISDSVTNIEESAFAQCANLKSITLPFVGKERGNSRSPTANFGYIFGPIPYVGGVNVMQHYGPAYENGSWYEYTIFVIPQTLENVKITDETIISYGAFDRCTQLKTVLVNEGVVIIDDAAFRSCEGLVSLDIPNGVTRIGSRAVEKCYSLYEITIPLSVEIISGWAFNNCTNLHQAYLPRRLNGALEESVFEECAEDLQIIYYDENLRYFNETLRTEDNSATNIVEVCANDCRVTFKWKCSCEPLVKGNLYDYMYFSIDGVQQAFICGETDWTEQSYTVSGADEHTFTWTYQKDDQDSVGEDCGWIRNVVVAPLVTLSFDGGDAESGVEPTAMSFYADDDTVVLPGCGTLARVKHSFVGWSDGETVYWAGTACPYLKIDQTLTAVWAANTLSAPTIFAPATYEADYATVTITAEEGASIYYTLDGSAPTEGSSLYSGPFEVAGNATVRAIAVRDNYFDSEVSWFEVTRLAWTFGEYLNCAERIFTTGGDAEWVRAKDVSADGFALRSGAITHSQTSRLETVVYGAGLIRFLCKVDGEIVKNSLYDGMEFCIDGVRQGDLMGDADWTEKTFEVAGDGRHVIVWQYVKDEDGDGGGEDCAWLDEVVWTPTGAETDPDHDMTYMVTFNANGGTGGISRVQGYASPIVAPTVSRTGYTFKGWLPSVAATVPNNDVTYTAQWEINQYTVTFDANGGSGGKSVTQDYGTALIAPTVTRTGYDFKGWSPTVPSTMPATNATYTAQWSSAWILKLDANGGELAGDGNMLIEKGEVVGELPIPTRGEFTFDGWYTEPSGGSKITSATKITNDTVFYAHWSAKIELVLADGCEGMGTVSGGGGVVAVGKKVTLKATPKKGYVFAGWYDGAGNPLSGGVDYRTATYPYVSTGEPTAITARFVPAEEDAAEENIGFAISGTADVYAAGEAIEQHVTVSSFSMPTVTVTGLPAGLKFDAKTLKITGKPTKPGELATATFTIKNQSNKTGKKETVAYRIGDARSGLLDLKYNTVPGEDGYALIVPGGETDMHGLLGLAPGDLAGWTITGLPAGLKFDSRTGTLSGKATQSGKTYLVTFKKGAEIATITLGTKPDPKLTLTKYLLVRDDIAPEVEDGTYYSNFKLTGGGNYQVGKKVSVSATAPKSWMFVGWASPSDLNPLDNTVRLTMVSTDAKYTFSMPSPGEEADEVELTAVFTHVFGSAIVPDDEIEE